MNEFKDIRSELQVKTNLSQLQFNQLKTEINSSLAQFE